MIEIPKNVKQHWKIVRELEEQTDRGAAIIGAAYLEDRLAEAIKTRLVSDFGAITYKSGRLEERIFRGQGPLGTFGAKIDLAYALGMLGENSHRDAHLIRSIRNDFAHIAEKTRFSTPKIKNQCGALWLPANMLWPGTKKPPAEPREQYLRTVTLIWNLLWNEMAQTKAIGEGAKILP